MKPSKEEIQDLSREQICKKYDVCDRTAIRWQKHYKLFESKISRLDEDRANKIREYHNLGHSPKDCEKFFKLSLTTVYRVLNNQIYPQIPQTANVSVSYNPDEN